MQEGPRSCAFPTRMVRNLKSYPIMHLDTHAATIRSDGACTIYKKRFMPYNLYLEETKDSNPDVRFNNRSNFCYWLGTRLLSPRRKYAEEIFCSLGLKPAAADPDRAAIAVFFHALCLTDVYWVRELREHVSYNEINLYDFDLTDAFADVSLRGHVLSAKEAGLLRQGDFACDLSTSGLAPKAWIRRDGAFWLLKGGSEKEVEAELTASRIARCFDVDQVLYEPMDFHGQRVSRSRLITSKEKSIVPAEYVSVHADNLGKSLYEMAKTNDAYGYHMMNILDYLTGNTDRHWGNWGFWVDNQDNRLGKLHPLMDFNQSFHAYDTLEGARCLTAEGHLSQREAAVQGVQAVGLNQIHALPEDLSSLFGTVNQLFQSRLDKMFMKRLQILKEAENPRKT